MYKVSDEQIDFILNDFQLRGVILEDLRYDLLDHVCCIVEGEMNENEDFFKFYDYIIPRFFKNELKEIQEETELLLTFKNYYAMKKTLNIAGIASAIFTLMGATFKTFHLPGAAVIMLLGFLLFSTVFLPLMIVLKFKDEESKTDKWVFSIGLLLAMITSLGLLFKLMHWPGANIMMRSGLTAVVFGYVPLYFFTRVRRPEQRFNATVNSVLMMACGGLLYALINLGFSKSLKESLVTSHEFLVHNTEQMTKANNLLAEKRTSTNDDLFLQSSHRLFDRINQIKWNLVAISNRTSKENAKSISITELRNPDDYGSVETSFEKATGELSMKGLLLEMTTYNKSVELVFPGKQEKVIALDKVQLDRTILSVLLHELTQIQLLIVTNENSYLSTSH